MKTIRIQVHPTGIIFIDFEGLDENGRFRLLGEILEDIPKELCFRC